MTLWANTHIKPNLQVDVIKKVFVNEYVAIALSTIVLIAAIYGLALIESVKKD